METFQGEWLVLVINVIVIAFVITFPLLVGFIVMRVLRKSVSEDRRDFEREVMAKLEDMADTLTEIAQQLSTSLK